MSGKWDEDPTLRVHNARDLGRIRARVMAALVERETLGLPVTSSVSFVLDEHDMLTVRFEQRFGSGLRGVRAVEYSEGDALSVRMAVSADVVLDGLTARAIRALESVLALQPPKGAR